MLLKLIDENMILYREDMAKDIALYHLRIEKIFNQLLTNADAFFDENISIFKLGLLMDNAAFKKKFEDDVLMELNKPIDDVIHEVSDLIFKRSKKQADYIISHLGERPVQYSINLQGELNQSAVDGIAQEMLMKIRSSTHSILHKYKPEDTTQIIVNKVKKSVFQIGLIEATSAVTLSSLMMIQMLDITGIIASSSIALMGLVVLPWKKSSLRYWFNDCLC